MCFPKGRSTRNERKSCSSGERKFRLRPTAGSLAKVRKVASRACSNFHAQRKSVSLAAGLSARWPGLPLVRRALVAAVVRVEFVDCTVALRQIPQ
jgi:hypothetical protein